MQRTLLVPADPFLPREGVELFTTLTADRQILVFSHRARLTDGAATVQILATVATLSPGRKLAQQFLLPMRLSGMVDYLHVDGRDASG